MLRPPTKHRLLWLAVHADKVGSNAYIVYALFVAPPILALIDDPSITLAVWLSLIFGAIALAILGICMAVGLGLAARNPDALDFDWYRSHFESGDLS
ncbi:hypothetical protein GOEFS_080_00120 [Gordonia effusa NBRC 100432]|uniref:Uncharacterized protein n=1 Tax=Gordonia effusa NBRC 100432 TaxID=1077974 RepID=H0R2J9_9ACTN|nr:hypothetical protein [Gordonia effusa]GAB19300.1 hypothetical protein GOEFS_080_00120 [Gordonia effusa NBRC 100432]